MLQLCTKESQIKQRKRLHATKPIQQQQQQKKPEVKKKKPL